MTRRVELIAVMPRSGEGAPPDCAVVEAGAFRAILAPPAGLAARFGGRRAAMRGAAARLRQLETLLDRGTVLPALPGTMLARDDVEAALKTNSDALQRLERRFRGHVQYQLVLRWDPVDALDHFRDRAGAPGASGELETLRRHIADLFRERLTAIATEMEMLPVADDMAVNAVLMVRRDRQDALDAALEQLDALWSEGFALKLIGPTPPYSFGSIGFRVVTDADIAEASRCLGVAPGAAADVVARARRLALMRGDAARQDEIRAAAETLDLVAARPKSATTLHALFVWREGRSRSGPSIGLQGAA